MPWLGIRSAGVRTATHLPRSAEPQDHGARWRPHRHLLRTSPRPGCRKKLWRRDVQGCAFGQTFPEPAAGRLLLAGHAHPLAIGCSRQAKCCQLNRMATSLATQALPPATTGWHWMKSSPHLNSHDGPWRVQLEGFSPTRNRKVEGSNPSSGSKTAGQRGFLAMLTGQRQQAVIPLVGHRAVSASAPLRYEESVWPIEGPSMGLLRRPTPGEIVEGGRLGRPCGPGALRARSEKTSLRLCRLSHFYTQSGQVAWRCRSGTCSLLRAVGGCGTRRR
jgi:hypothetical protein